MPPHPPRGTWRSAEHYSRFMPRTGIKDPSLAINKPSPFPFATKFCWIVCEVWVLAFFFPFDCTQGVRQNVLRLLYPLQRLPRPARPNQAPLYLLPQTTAPCDGNVPLGMALCGHRLAEKIQLRRFCTCLLDSCPNFV
jgi:hypothetical protein